YVDDLMNERGIAMPMAMIALAILAALMVAFVALATTEPQIATNHMAAAQARGLAESGIESTLQQLPALIGAAANEDPNFTFVPCPGGLAVPAGFNGTTFVPVNAYGGFTVTLGPVPAPACTARTVVISAVGYMGNNLTQANYLTNYTAKKVITVRA